MSTNQNSNHSLPLLHFPNPQSPLIHLVSFTSYIRCHTFRCVCIYIRNTNRNLSQCEIISLLVWLNIQHRCFYTVSSLSSDNGCASFTQQHVIFCCSLGDNKTGISCVKLIAVIFILVLSNRISPCYKPTMGFSFNLFWQLDSPHHKGFVLY